MEQSAATSSAAADAVVNERRPAAQRLPNDGSDVSISERVAEETSSTRDDIFLDERGESGKRDLEQQQEREEQSPIAASFYTVRNFVASEHDERLLLGETTFAVDDEHVFRDAGTTTALKSEEEAVEVRATPVSIFPPPRQTWLPRIDFRDARKLVDKLNAAAQLDVARDSNKNLALAERLTQEVVNEIIEVHAASRNFDIPHFADGRNIFSIPVSVRVLNIPSALRTWGGINTAATNGRSIVISEAIMANSWETFPAHFRRPNGDTHYALVILHEIGHIVKRRAPRLFDAANIDLSLYSPEVPADIYSSSFLRFADRARAKASTT